MASGDRHGRVFWDNDLVAVEQTECRFVPIAVAPADGIISDEPNDRDLDVHENVLRTPSDQIRSGLPTSYIWTAEDWLYVSAVIELFSRGVVGWSMSTTMTAQLVADALLMAVWRCGKPRELLHHSDQGSQYSSE